VELVDGGVTGVGAVGVEGAGVTALTQVGRSGPPQAMAIMT